MNSLSPHTIKQTAAQRLSDSTYSPRKLIALHTGLSLAITLIISFLSYFLSRQIDDTSGLSGIGLRATLTTIQSGLQLAATVALPFWEIGFMRAALSMGRSQPAGPSTLLAGFRRFGPVLRLMFLLMLMFSILMMLCIYVGTGIFMMTPAAASYVEAMMPLIEDLSALNPELSLDEATLSALMDTLMPAYLISAVLLAAASIPLLYRLRMASFAIMDDQRIGAFTAVRKSWKMTRHNCLRLFRLDLSFWWFYGLQLLLVAVAYLDLLLPALGITLSDSAFLWFSLLQAVGQLALYWWAGSLVHTSYAVAYDTLQESAQHTAIPTAPKHLPWDYS